MYIVWVVVRCGQLDNTSLVPGLVGVHSEALTTDAKPNCSSLMVCLVLPHVLIHYPTFSYLPPTFLLPSSYLSPTFLIPFCKRRTLMLRSQGQLHGPGCSKPAPSQLRSAQNQLRSAQNQDSCMDRKTPLRSAQNQLQASFACLCSFYPLYVYGCLCLLSSDQCLLTMLESSQGM